MSSSFSQETETMDITNNIAIIKISFFMVDVFRLKCKITKTSFKYSFVYCIDKLDIMKKLLLFLLLAPMVSCLGVDIEN